MADPADKELADGLKGAKKKARNFAIILKGTKVVHLIVQKKSIKAGDLAGGKSEFGGNAVLQGVCQGDGADLVFKMIGEPGTEPPVKIAQFKELITEKTDLKIKPCFEMVLSLDPIDEKEEDESEAEDAVPKAVVPPPAPPPAPAAEAVPPPAPAPADLMKQLVAAMNKMGDGIKAAVVAVPARKTELLTQVAGFQTQVKAADADAAKASLLAVGKLIKEMTGAAPAAPPPPAAAAPVPPPVAPPAPEPSKGAQWEKAFAEMEPRYLEALKSAPGDAASKLRVVFTYATEQAEAGQFDKALASLKRLEPLIAEALASPGKTPEIAAGTVEKRKFLLTRFKQIPGEIRPEVNKLKASIAREVPDEDPDELGSAIEASLQSFYDEIQDEIDKAINSGDMKVMSGLKGRVMKNELISHLFDNPLTDGSKFRESLIGALEEVEAKLAG